MCAEFPKVASLRPQGRAKNFKDYARFGLLKAKMHNSPLFYLFWVIFLNFFLVFDIFLKFVQMTQLDIELKTSMTSWNIYPGVNFLILKI